MQSQVEMLWTDFKSEVSFLKEQINTYIIYYSTMEMLTYFHSMSVKASLCSYIILQLLFSITAGNGSVSDLTVYHSLNQWMHVGKWWPKIRNVKKVFRNTDPGR